MPSSSLQPFVYVLLLGVSGLFLFSGLCSPGRQPNKALLTPDPQPKVVAAKYDKPKQLKRTPYTLDSFRVHGVNLARYGFEDEHPSQEERSAEDKEKNSATVLLSSNYKLYDDFAVPMKRLKDNSTWADLIHGHRRLSHRSLAFYMDKIAQK